MDIVLINGFGIEIDRASVERQDEALDVIAKWMPTIGVGDRIVFEETYEAKEFLE